MRSLRSTSRALLVLLLLGASACGAAVPPPAPPTVAAAPPARAERPLPLWAIQSPDGHTSYVLGTYHLGVHIHEVLPGDHARALDEARVLLVEVDVANADPAALLAHAMLPQDQDLHDLIPPDLWPRLVSALVGVVPEPALHRLRPWFVMAALMSREASALESERRGEGSSTDAPSLLDVQVMERARERGISVVPLETVDEQGAMMNALPLSTVIRYLDRVLAPARSGSSLDDLMEAYLAGDDATLEAMAFDLDEWGGSTELLDAFVFARNERWLDRVEAEMRRGGAFVAVGMAHLIGDRGLVRLLEARGFTAIRLHREE